jgi:hypothetical protein
MGELESVAVGAAIIVGILTWNIRIGAVAGVLVCIALLWLITSKSYVSY